MKHSLRHLMLLATMLFCITASAYDFEVDGIYYDIVSLEKLTCETTFGDNEYTGEVVIPSTVTYKNRNLSVTRVGSRTFNGSKLTTVTIPNSVTRIDHSAFCNGCKIKSLVIEDGEETLDISAAWYHNAYLVTMFYQSSMETLYIGRNLSWSDSPFQSISSLKNVTIGNSVTSIADYAFRGCTGLTNIIIPNSVISIGKYAFSSCSALTDITIGNSVTSIAEHAFKGCKALTNLTIPGSVTSIGNMAFEDCNEMKSFVFEDGESTLNLYNFYDCPLETLYLGRNLSYKTYGYGFMSPFEEQKRLKNVTISNSVTSIGYGLFYGCSSLNSILIPNSVTSIGRHAFSGCSAITNITIPASVVSIEENAISSCSALTSITSLNPVPPTLEDNFSNKQYMELTIYVPREAVSAYQAADVWKNFWDIQGIDVTGIQNIETKENAPTVIYDLQGRKLKIPQRGINIINGKKILVK